MKLKTIIILLLLFIISIQLYIYIYYNIHINKDKKKQTKLDMFLPLSYGEKQFINKNILLTREYQLKLYKNIFNNRNQSISYYLNKLSLILKLNLTLQNGYETIRLQQVLNTSVCGKDYNPRIRHYYTGYRINTSTLDIKSSTNGYEDPSSIYTKEWIPSLHYINYSEQKYEWDIHPCKVKYSIETRISIPFEYTPVYCYDLTLLFPKIEKKILDKDKYNLISINDYYTTWIYELEHHGFLYDGITKYKSSFLIQYNSKYDALNGISYPSHSPEWSLRIWSSNNGTNRWIKNTIELINYQYKQILREIITPDLPCKQDKNYEIL